MTRIFAIMLIATACGGVIFNSTTIAMPKVFDERLAALTQTSLGIGALVAIVYTMAAFAQVLMGSLIDRFELRRLMIGVALVQIPMLALAANLQGWAMLGAALLMMLAIFGQIPLNDAIVGRYVADEYRARVLSVRYVVSLGVAAVAVPMIALLHKTAGRLQQRVPGAGGARFGDAARFAVLPVTAAGHASAVGCSDDLAKNRGQSPISVYFRRFFCAWRKSGSDPDFSRVRPYFRRGPWVGART